MHALDYIRDDAPNPAELACLSDDEPAPLTPNKAGADLSDAILRCLLWADEGRTADAIASRVRFALAFLAEPRASLSAWSEEAQLSKSHTFRLHGKLRQFLRK